MMLEGLACCTVDFFVTKRSDAATSIAVRFFCVSDKICPRSISDPFPTKQNLLTPLRDKLRSSCVQLLAKKPHRRNHALRAFRTSHAARLIRILFVPGK